MTEKKPRSFAITGILPLTAVLVTGLLGLALPVAAEGQETEEGDTLPSLFERESPADTIAPIPVDPIIVSVLRSPMALDQSPFAVSVLGEESLQGLRSATSLNESLRGLPGVQVQNRFNDAVGERLAVRGFGARSQFGIRGVKVLVDGIPATLPDGQSTLDHLDLGSVGRVEALRGPGSSLYGNAAGGVLSFETRRPPDTSLEQEFEWLSASDRTDRWQSSTAGRVGDTGYLLNVAGYRADGFRGNPVDGGRPSYGSSDRTHLNAQLEQALGRGELRVTFNWADLDAENPGALTRAELETETLEAVPFNVLQGTGKELRQGQMGVSWAGPLGAQVIEVMAFGVRRSLTNPIPPAIVDLDRNAGGVRGMVRGDHESDAGRLWWAVGLELEGQFDDRLNHDNDGGTRGELTLDQSERVLAGASFAQLSLPINPILTVMMGLRYDRIHFEATDRFDDPDAPPGTGTRAMDSASPSFGLHAGFHETFGFYGNLSTAFETPTTTELVNRPEGAGGFNPELEPQVGMTAEVGARGIFGSVAAYELAYFHTTLRNELIPFEVPDVPGRSFFRNAGSSVRDGVEATFRLAPTHWISGQLAYAYTSARFRSYEVDGENLRGRRIPGLAPHRAQGSILLRPGPAYAELAVEYVDRIASNDLNTPESFAPSHVITDLRLGIDELSLGRFHLSPFGGVTNLFDEYYAASVTVNAFGGRYFEPGPGRSVYLGLRAGWRN